MSKKSDMKNRLARLDYLRVSGSTLGSGLFLSLSENLALRTPLRNVLLNNSKWDFFPNS